MVRGVPSASPNTEQTRRPPIQGVSGVAAGNIFDSRRVVGSNGPPLEPNQQLICLKPRYTQALHACIESEG